MISAIRFLLAFGSLTLAVLVGCDQEKQHDAAAKAGEGVEKAVNAVGNASRDAAHAVGNVVEKAGDKMQSAADRATTRPATSVPLP